MKRENVLHRLLLLPGFLQDAYTLVQGPAFCGIFGTLKGQKLQGEAKLFSANGLLLCDDSRLGPEF